MFATCPSKDALQPKGTMGINGGGSQKACQSFNEQFSGGKCWGWRAWSQRPTSALSISRDLGWRFIICFILFTSLPACVCETLVESVKLKFCCWGRTATCSACISQNLSHGVSHALLHLHFSGPCAVLGGGRSWNSGIFPITPSAKSASDWRVVSSMQPLSSVMPNVPTSTWGISLGFMLIDRHTRSTSGELFINGTW